jgi:hypothetical protein
VLSLSKLGDIPIRLHRAIPDDAALKQVTVKKKPTGEWFVTFGVEMDREPPEPPETPERCVGIDVGILTYAHDTDGTAVGSLDLSAERDRLERERRSLSRTEHGSNNYEEQRRSGRGVSRRPETEAPRLFAQTLELLRHRVRLRGGRRVEREGDARITVEQSQHGVGGVANVSLVTRIQVRPRRDALRGGDPERDDERVRGVRCLDGKAVMGP